MKINTFFLFIILFASVGLLFAETEKEKIVHPKDYTADIKTAERSNYKIEIKQYKKDYPVVLYLIFGTEIPSAGDIKNLIYKELKISAKKEGASNNIIASAWSDDGISDNLTKIELSDNSSAFVWLSKEKQIMSFAEYLKFLKKQKKDKKNKNIPIK
jgi:hypothetical protein